MSEVTNNVSVREPFVCDNDMKAEWCLMKIRKARREQQEQKEELQRQMQFYIDQMAVVDHEADEEVSFFEGILKGYFQKRVDEGFTKEAKTKVSYKLPTGELMMKHRDPEYDYKTNQDQTIKFLEKNKMDAAFVKVKKELNWKDMKPFTKVVDGSVVMKETGEIVPGITATEREDEFIVEVK